MWQVSHEGLEDQRTSIPHEGAWRQSFVRGGGRGQGRRRRAERPLRLSDTSDHSSAHASGAGWRVDFSDDLAEVLVGHEVVQGSFVAEGVLYVGDAVLQAEALDDFDAVEPGFALLSRLGFLAESRCQVVGG